MSSPIQIANVALVRLRADTIQNLTEGSTEAISVNALWDVSRRAVLSLHTWNFALAEVEISQTISITPLEATYRYQLPSDLIRLVKVIDDMSYRIVGNQLYTNKQTCKIRYVFDQTDTATWSPLFVDLFAARLSWELAYPITASQSTATAAQNSYEMKLREARFTDSTQDIQESFSQGRNSLMSARY